MNINFANYKPSIMFLFLALSFSVLSGAFSMLWGYGMPQTLGPLFAISLFFAAYDKWLWKLPVLCWMNTAPNLNGSYVGEIEYIWDNQRNKKPCALSIRQTCSKIVVESIFGEGTEEETQSESTDTFLVSDETGGHRLYIYYCNIGHFDSDKRLNQHNGFNVLTIKKDGKSVELKGHYFTNRDPQTKGLVRVSNTQEDVA